MCRMVIRILLVCNLLLYFTRSADLGPEFPGTAADSKKLQEEGGCGRKNK